MISPKIDTCLGAGRVDPFMSIDSTKIPPYGHEVLDYGSTPLTRLLLFAKLMNFL